jgi:hypothetical protein
MLSFPSFVFHISFYRCIKIIFCLIKIQDRKIISVSREIINADGCLSAWLYYEVLGSGNVLWNPAGNHPTPDLALSRLFLFTFYWAWA